MLDEAGSICPSRPLRCQTPLMDDELRDMIDTVALNRLHSAYSDTCTRQVWSELPNVLLPDATVTIDLQNQGSMVFIGPSELGEFIGKSLQQFEFFQFVVLNSHFMLRTDGNVDRATGRMWMSELRQFASNGRWSQIYGLYRDEYRRVDGRWMISARRYQSLARPNRDIEIFPIPTD
jgi:SnoaL-like domain